MLSAILSAMADWSITSWISVLLIGILSAILYEQLSYQQKKGSLPGPSFVPGPPFLGGILAMVQAPYDFWHKQMAMGPISWNAIVGKFFVMVTEASNVRKVFENVSETMPLVLHPNAEYLLGKGNIAFLNGEEHRELKQSLLPLFTQRALSVYLSLQEKHIRDCLKEWVSLNQRGQRPLLMRELIYDLNTNTSMTVFVGPYLTPESRKQFQNDYATLTAGILGLPFPIPGTKVYAGKQAVTRICSNLSAIAGQAKARMRKNAEPRCLLDFWMINVNQNIDQAEKDGSERPLHTADDEIGHILLDFLFASQDASSSSLTFATHFLCEYPDVLQKIREEQSRVRADHTTPFTPDLLAELKYTSQVVKEVLRFRPPATIVPHIAKTPFQVDDTYTAPAGTLIVPSVWNSNRCGFADPEKFDPDRFSAERQEHLKYDKNFLTFGCGPHRCLGYRYAMNHILLYISLMASECDLVRMKTPNMYEINYLPTIYPADGCMLDSLTFRT